MVSLQLESGEGTLSAQEEDRPEVRHSMATPEQILDDAGVGSITRLIIPCVDPAYPVSCLGEGFEDNLVVYTPGDHPLGGRVQLAPAAATHIFMRYSKSRPPFETIDQQEVHASLPLGVIPVARLGNGAAVMGIPGDALAFNPAGPGFAFGRPRAAPPAAAKKGPPGIARPRSRQRGPHGAHRLQRLRAQHRQASSVRLEGWRQLHGQ